MFFRFGTLSVALAILSSAAASSMELPRSFFDRGREGTKFEMSLPSMPAAASFAAGGSPWTDPEDSRGRPHLKSPVRGFFYSLLVPGLGQFYYGSRIKPLVFLSVEAAS